MTVDLGPAATPRPIPTREDRMSTDDRIPVRCHTVDEHHRMAGDTADTRSQDRAIRELTAERDKARRERDSLACRLALRFEETEKLRAGLAAAQRTIAAQAAQIRANGTLLARLHDLAEQADRAWAEHDTAAEQDTASVLQRGQDELDHAGEVIPASPAVLAAAAGLGSPADRAQD